MRRNRWIVLFGATSTIGRELARAWATENYALVIVGRQHEEVSRVAEDLRLRYGGPVRSVTMDALDRDFAEAIADLGAELSEIAGIVWAWGVLPTQGISPEHVVAVNLTAAMVAVETLIARLAPDGFVALLSSVAGDRGRRSNYWYGAAKAGLTVYGQGLRHRLGGRVTVVKLGMVDTQMTQGMRLIGAADPDRVARQIADAVRRDRGVVYIPWWWRWVMAGVQRIPPAIFQRMDF